MTTQTTQIHPTSIVHKDAQLASGVVIGPHCVVESGASIGENTILSSNVVIGENVQIGKNNRFFPMCVIGGNPQILGLKDDSPVGRLVIGDGNTIREQVTIHPSMHAGEFTKIGNENLLMIGVHIGHDCILEDKLVMSNYTQISGHCKIQTGVWFSGLVMLHQFVTIGKWCYGAALAGVNHDIPPFLIISGHYPTEVRGVNKRGMMRAGLNSQQQQNIMEAYKRLYRQKTPLLKNAKAMAQEEGLDENVRAMVDMVLKSSEQRFGRYLEKFRH